jgi:predicted nucleotidyltransferase
VTTESRDSTQTAAAVAAAGVLSSDKDVVAVCLLGSVARGDATPTSDTDLFVIAGGDARPSRFYERLGSHDDALSLMVQSPERFAEATELGTLFALHVRAEGRVLFDRDGWLARQLAATRDVTPNPGWTLEWAEREVQRYKDVARFNGIFLHALARLYSIGRAVVIALTVEAGKPEFGKDRAFGAAAQRFPQLLPEISRVAALRPFHERADGGRAVLLPFDHHGADAAVQQAVVDIERLLMEDVM